MQCLLSPKSHDWIGILQYHCRFDDFFEAINVNGPDVTMSANWKQLASFCCTDGTPTALNPQEMISNVVIPPA